MCLYCFLLNVPKSDFQDCCPYSELNFKSKNLKTQFFPITLDQIDFFEPKVPIYLFPLSMREI